MTISYIAQFFRDFTNTNDMGLDWKSCLLSNISICTTSQEADKFLVFVYNPLSWNVTHYVRLPVETNNFVIRGPDGK